MQAVTVIKVTRQAPDIEFIEERAVVDFDAFEAIAALHIKRVRTPYAINRISEVLERLQKGLHSKRLLVD